MGGGREYPDAPDPGRKIAKNVRYIDDNSHKILDEGIIKIERQLIALIRSIRKTKT